MVGVLFLVLMTCYTYMLTVILRFDIYGYSIACKIALLCLTAAFAIGMIMIVYCIMTKNDQLENAIFELKRQLIRKKTNDHEKDI